MLTKKQFTKKGKTNDAGVRGNVFKQQERTEFGQVDRVIGLKWYHTVHLQEHREGRIQKHRPKTGKEVDGIDVCENSVPNATILFKK